MKLEQLNTTQKLAVGAALLSLMVLAAFLHLHRSGLISYGDEEPPPDSYPGPPPLPPTELPWRVRVVLYPLLIAAALVVHYFYDIRGAGGAQREKSEEPGHDV